MQTIEIKNIKQTQHDIIQASIKPDIKSQAKDQYILEKKIMKNNGRWTMSENLKYAIFVEINQKQFYEQRYRKVWKIFKAMSLYLKTRDTYQCRSHHQKMVVKFGSVEKIIQKIKENFSTQIYQLEKKSYLEGHQQLLEIIQPINSKRSTHLQHVSLSPDNNFPIDMNTYMMMCPNTLPYQPYYQTLTYMLQMTPQGYCVYNYSLLGQSV